MFNRFQSFFNGIILGTIFYVNQYFIYPKFVVLRGQAKPRRLQEKFLNLLQAADPSVPMIYYLLSRMRRSKLFSSLPGGNAPRINSDGIRLSQFCSANRQVRRAVVPSAPPPPVRETQKLD